jgi:hypothetical protein
VHGERNQRDHRLRCRAADLAGSRFGSGEGFDVGRIHGGNAELRNAIRAHSHFAEYVPIIALVVAMLEIAGLKRVPCRSHNLRSTT